MNKYTRTNNSTFTDIFYKKLIYKCEDYNDDYLRGIEKCLKVMVEYGMGSIIFENVRKRIKQEIAYQYELDIDV